MKRLRGEAASAGALSPDDADKPAGCAMPLTLAVSEGQRKKELALGISVRTGVGDSEEFETDTLTFMPGSQVRRGSFVALLEGNGAVQAYPTTRIITMLTSNQPTGLCFWHS